VSAYPNSDLNPVLAAGNCRVSVISSGESPPFFFVLEAKFKAKRTEESVLVEQLKKEQILFESTRRKTGGSAESGLLRGFWENHTETRGNRCLGFHSLYNKGRRVLFKIFFHSLVCCSFLFQLYFCTTSETITLLR